MATSAEVDEEIVYGYLRSYNHIIELPADLWDLIYLFYHWTFEIMKFSQHYKSKTGYKLTDDNKCAQRFGCDGSRWIVGNDPVFEGIHCWRIFVDNPDKRLVIYAISKAYQFYDDSKYGQDNIIGIGWDDICFHDMEFNVASHQRTAKVMGGQYRCYRKEQCQHFHGAEMCVDILLDCDEGTVEFAVIEKDPKEELFRPLFTRLEKNPDYGYVPHLICSAEGLTDDVSVTFRLFKIDIDKFGIYDAAMDWDLFK